MCPRFLPAFLPACLPESPSVWKRFKRVDTLPEHRHAILGVSDDLRCQILTVIALARSNCVFFGHCLPERSSTLDCLQCFARPGARRSPVSCLNRLVSRPWSRGISPFRINHLQNRLFVYTDPFCAGFRAELLFAPDSGCSSRQPKGPIPARILPKKIFHGKDSTMLAIFGESTVEISALESTTWFLTFRKLENVLQTKDLRVSIARVDNKGLTPYWR